MRIKKFTAPTYTYALELVKKEMGNDALILSTRSLRPEGDATARDHASMVEITVAVDYRPIEESGPQPAEPSVSSEPGLEFLENAPDLKSLLLPLLGQTEKAQSLGLKSHHLEHYSHLVENGVSEKLASKIIARASGKKNGTKNGPLKKSQLVQLVSRILRCDGEIRLKDKGPKIVALVGPTGAGKTTTLAKLAADFAYRQNKKVALISLDTYRLGAIDQLRIYGDIMRVPFEVAADRGQFRQAVQKHRDKDIILVDTMGRSHKDKDYSGELKNIFTSVDEVETHLVLTVTSQERLFSKVLKQFSPSWDRSCVVHQVGRGIGLRTATQLFPEIPLAIVLSYYGTKGSRRP